MVLEWDNSEIEKAWTLRFQNKTSPFIETVKKLSQNTPTNPQILLLNASLQRLTNNILESENMVKKAYEICQDQGIPAPHELFFQRGLNLYHKGLYVSAYEDFNTAAETARHGTQRSMARLNQIFCLDCIGSPLLHTGGEIEKKLATLEEKEVLPALAEQLEAFRFRLNFRRGIFVSRIPQYLHTQTDYLNLWICQLPYHTGYDSDFAALIDKALDAKNAFYQRRYRIEMIMGKSETSGENVSPKEMADRLYLWVWRWICTGDVFLFKECVAQVDQLSEYAISNKLTFEDRILMSNALKWIFLFASSDEDEMEYSELCLTDSQTSGYELLNAESKMIDLFKEFKKNNSMNYPAEFEDSSIYFSSLINGALKGQLVSRNKLIEKLSINLQSLLKVNLKAEAELLVDIPNHKVIQLKHKKEFISAPLCSLIDLLTKRRALSFDEIMVHCFGFQKYDEIHHQSRIFNLISRLKKIFPKEFQFYTKSGKLFCHGPYENIIILRPHLLTEQINQYFPIKKTESLKVTPLGKLSDVLMRLGKELGDKREFSRKDLEKLIGRSRSTSYRTIKKLCQKGLIKTSGTAKNTIYILGTFQKIDS
jgi:hypothetical protein